MAISTPSATELESAATRTASTPWARGLARIGFAAKAVVYTEVALLALAVAAGERGRTSDARGALAELSAAPWGRALVLLVAIGLACYALWFVLAGVADPGRHRRDAKGLLSRGAKVIAGFMHGALALFAFQLALGEVHLRSGDAAARSWTARALSLPAGALLVLAIGLIAAGIGLRQMYKGWRCLRRSQLRTERMGSTLRRWAPRIGCAGLVAQGTVVLLVGAFLVQASLARDPREATGFDGALAWIARQPWGVALLFAAGFGLLAYAAWTALEARYRRLPA